MITRCDWIGFTDPCYIHYHDTEWGVPVRDDRHLFEMLILEGAQAGLSWLTILKKRENYRTAYDSFDPEKIASYTDKKIQVLLANPGIVRNQRKIEASIRNAKVFLEIQKEFSSFSSWLWGFVNGVPTQGNYKTLNEVPVTTELSATISAALKKRGMSFVGPTIIQAYIQAVGLVNNHITSCFRFKECAGKNLALK
ncbi:MAG TPA: DNA-3-methyladenine glycosylase I [Treponema sp.]|nr:DNA-3-methyladenine glycosylase I [Treponema sp.]